MSVSQPRFLSFGHSRRLGVTFPGAGTLVFSLLVQVFAVPASAQDVELLGQQYGTRPPAEYFARIGQDPGAFQFNSGWTPRLRSVLELREPAEGDGPGPDLPAFDGLSLAGILGRRDAVEGTFRLPIIMGMFSDSPGAPPYDLEAVRTHFVDGPNPHGTIPDYYREVSGGRVELLPEVSDWIRVGLEGSEVTGGTSGLGNGSRVGEFIIQVLREMEDSQAIDWGQFDNDGPDGIPNSGDDDGFVDVLAVIHPTRGAECGGTGNSNRIWSHRWSLASAFDVYVTDAVSNSEALRSPSTGELGRVRINDYTIQPVLSCNDASINEIGVFVHELGHGFGIPDLYAVGGNHGAVGNWGLMGSGSWGCRGGNPSRPCHMGAWSKEVLGWADVDVVEPGAELGDVVLNPVSAGGAILRVDALDESGEYFLLENRQALGFDEDLLAPGVLVWQVSPTVLDESWRSNRVNSDPQRMGVRIRQADGLNNLGTGGEGRGDEGDIFPGSTDNRAFHAGSVPGSWTFDGETAGVTILDIAQVGEGMRFQLVNRYQDVAVELEGATLETALIQLDGQELEAADGTTLGFTSAPFQEHVLEARGRVDAGQGVRLGFEGWDDNPDRSRPWVTGLADTTVIATFSGEEVRLAIDLESPYPEVNPGTIATDPAVEGPFWFPRGTEVSVWAEATTGFEFSGWCGGLQGEPNPATLTMSDPLSAEAIFALTYGIDGLDETLEMEATVAQEVIFSVVNATDPITWTLLPADGLPLGLRMEPDGRILGVPLETGSFPVAIRAKDGRSLTVEQSLTVEVAEPRLGGEVLTAPFFGSNSALSEAQVQFLDGTGNGNGIYDLGDFRAFLIRNPDLPMSADLGEMVRTLIELGPVSRPEGRNP